ncbi:MAG: LPS export ABC transporter periplasmic protein LptC [Bacteroidia bacterium]
MKRIFANCFFIFFLLLGFSACENDIAVVNTITGETEKQLPDQSNKNAEFLYSDSAVVRAKLTTPQLDHYAGKKPYFELPKGMNVIFYTAEKKEETKLTANYGIGYDNGNGMEKMEAKGNVIVINVKGEKLNTEHLIWNAITKKIYTDDFVKITTKDQTIMGDGMEADQNFSNYHIKNVKGVIYTKDSVDTNKEKK